MGEKGREASLINTCKGKKGARGTEQRGELNCDACVAEASAHLPWSSGAKMALKIRLILRQMNWTFVSLL